MEESDGPKGPDNYHWWGKVHNGQRSVHVMFMVYNHSAILSCTVTCNTCITCTNWGYHLFWSVLPEILLGAISSEHVKTLRAALWQGGANTAAFSSQASSSEVGHLGIACTACTNYGLSLALYWCVVGKVSYTRALSCPCHWLHESQAFLHYG